MLVVSCDQDGVAGGGVLDEESQDSVAGFFVETLNALLGTGFKVSLEGGRIEHDFTGGAVAAELAKRLRPDLAKLMREAEPKTEK